MDAKTKVRRRTRLGDLEVVGRSRDDRTDNAPDDVVNELVRHRRRDDKEEEGGCERSGCLTADHFLCILITKKKSSEYGQLPVSKKEYWRLLHERFPNYGALPNAHPKSWTHTQSRLH